MAARFRLVNYYNLPRFIKRAICGDNIRDENGWYMCLFRPIWDGLSLVTAPTGPILVLGCPRRRRSRVSDSELDVITVAGVGYLVTYHDAIWIPVDGSKRLSWNFCDVAECVWTIQKISNSCCMFIFSWTTHQKGYLKYSNSENMIHWCSQKHHPFARHWRCGVSPPTHLTQVWSRSHGRSLEQFGKGRAMGRECSVWSDAVFCFLQRIIQDLGGNSCFNHI